MLTYFLNERRRLKLVGSGAFSPGNFSDFNSLKFLFLGESFRKDIGQFHSPRMKPCESADYLSRSISML